MVCEIPNTWKNITNSLVGRYFLLEEANQPNVYLNTKNVCDLIKNLMMGSNDSPEQMASSDSCSQHKKIEISNLEFSTAHCNLCLQNGVLEVGRQLLFGFLTIVRKRILNMGQRKPSTSVSTSPP